MIKQPIATLCSFAVGLWAYQTGLWWFAIPMMGLLESRDVIRRRWRLAPELISVIHVGVVCLWLATVIGLPPNSPMAVPYAARYQVIKGLPIALFPLLLAQTYCSNFIDHYGGLWRDRLGNPRPFNFYFVYFAICLIAASVTGGNNGLFLLSTAVLVMAMLWIYRPMRYAPSTFLTLMAIALVTSWVSAHQFAGWHSQLKGVNPISSLVQTLSTAWRNQFPLQDWPNSPPISSPISPKDWQVLPPPASEFEIARTRQGDQPRNNSRDSRRSNVPGEINPPQGSDLANPVHETGEFDSGMERATDSQEGDISTGDDSEAVRTNTADPNQGSASPELPSEVGSDLNPTDAPVASAPSSASLSASTGNPSGLSSGGAGSLPLDQLQGLVHQVGGSADPQRSQTRIGAQGSLQLSDGVVFRVKPISKGARLAFPLLFREAAYNHYEGGQWQALNPRFESLRSRLGSTLWQLAPNTVATESMELSELSPLGNQALKAPMGTVKLEDLSVQSLRRNQFGTLLRTGMTRGQSGDRLTYRLHFALNQSFDLPPSQDDLRVPPAEEKSLKQVIESLDLQGLSASQKVQRVAQFFERGNFVYALKLPPQPSGKTPLAAFLQDYRAGHCEYYASATTLLLRTAGIPARYTVGYAVRELDPTTQDYVARLKDAHAWVTAYVDGRWKILDTTPAVLTDSSASPSQLVDQRGAIAPSSSPVGADPAPFVASNPRSTLSSQPDNDSPLQEAIAQGADWWDRCVQRGRELWAALKAGWSKFIQPHLWFGSFLLLGLAIIFMAMLWIWRLWRPVQENQPKRRRSLGRRSKEPLPQTYSFQDIEVYLQTLNLSRAPAETPMKWLQRLEHHLPTDQFSTLKPIFDWHYRDRFDPNGLSSDEEVLFQSMIREWLNPG